MFVSNIDSIKCPSCGFKNYIIEEEGKEIGITIKDIISDFDEDSEEEILKCRCLSCNQLFSVTIYIEVIKEFEFEFEIEKVDENENIIKDIPGQIFIWKNLLISKK